MVPKPTRPDSEVPIPPPVVRPEPTDGGAAETEGWWPAAAQEPVGEPFNTRRRWSGRLAFPLLALAVLLAWRGVRMQGATASALPRWAWWMLAAISVIAGLAMMRIRHRRG